MSISLLLEMAASSNPDRTAVVSGEMRLTTNELSALADGGAGVIAASGAQHAAYVGTGGAMLPLLLFSSARAGVAFTPLNYRLSEDGLRYLGLALLASADRYGDRRRSGRQARRGCLIDLGTGHGWGRRRGRLQPDRGYRPWMRIRGTPKLGGH